jgi:sulfur-oxidizing protein SoxY
MRRIAMILAVSVVVATAWPVAGRAEVDEATRQARWAELRNQIFGDRIVEDGAELLAIDAATRAEDAAIVPIKIRLGDGLSRRVSAVYLVIDDNPSPLAGHFTFGPAADPREIATRVRIDDYTYLHAVVETKDGKLYGVARFIKAAGGCSAPAGKDQALAMQRLGQMKMSFIGEPRLGEAYQAHLLISHPNSSGMQMDQLTREYIPADFVRTVKIIYNGAPVLTLESDISISEDPSLTFAFVPTAPSGEVSVEAEDSDNRHFAHSWPVKTGPGS